MKVAIDKNCIQYIKDFTEFEYIYIFDNEPIDELIKLNLHCMHKDYADMIDVNLSSYDINCLKKANINDKDWKVAPKKEDYKFAIIVPNYNNDHR